MCHCSFDNKGKHFQPKKDYNVQVVPVFHVKGWPFHGLFFIIGPHAGEAQDAGYDAEFPQFRSGERWTQT